MKSPRKIVALIVLASAVALAALIETFNFLANQQRELVQQELQRLLGKEVSFTGLEVHLLGWPGFAAKELRIADDPRFAATPILRARELILGVKLSQLLFGRLVIDALTLIEPEFQVITDETGLHNLDLLAQRRKEFTPLPNLRAAPAERRPSAVIFAIEELRIEDGRVIYLDRSVKEPAELQLRDIDMTLIGLDPTKMSRLRLAAALVEGLGQDVRIEGLLFGVGPEQSWLRREMNLSIQLDSLHVPVVARAIAALRDKIPPELDVAGPMSLQAKAGGTLARPRLENLTLKAPLFGASDYNATVTGEVRFSERRSWEDAELKGQMTIDPLPMAGLRNLRWFAQSLPSALITDGNISVYGRFEGTWETLRIGALVRADKSEWRYQDWLRKRLRRPAEISARIARQKQKFFIYESVLVCGRNRVEFNGFIDAGAESKLQLKLSNRKGSVAGWSELLAPAVLVGIAGQTDLSLVIEQQSLPGNDDWSVQGYFRLSAGEFRHPPSGRKIDAADATVTFVGRQARFENVKFRLGTSTMTLDGVAPNLLEPYADFEIRSAQLNLSDLAELSTSVPGQLDDVSAKGALRWQDDEPVLDGMVQVRDGILYGLAFRDLRTDFTGSGGGLNFNHLSLRALDGVIRADGHVASAGDVELSAQTDALELRALAAQWLPPIKDRIQGQLRGRARFTLTAADGSGAPNALKVSIDSTVRGGAIKDFNLIGQLLLRGSGASTSAPASSRLPPGFAQLMARPDTTVESLKADFTVGPERIRTDNLIIGTTDYTITGAGWIDLNRSTRWNGLIALSPRATLEAQRDYRLLRYLVDRRGRLAITFRVDGTIPNVRIRLDNRALVQALRGNAPERGGDGARPSQSSQATSEKKKWLPAALERFLNR